MVVAPTDSKPLSLVGLRDGKHTPRWAAILARFAVYFVLVGVVVVLVTWISDLIFKTHDLSNRVRLVAIPGFLACLFVVHDVRRDLKRPAKDLAERDSGDHSERE